jgi:hypothetical protein
MEFCAAGVEPAHTEKGECLRVLTLICIFQLNVLQPFTINANVVVRLMLLRSGDAESYSVDSIVTGDL